MDLYLKMASLLLKNSYFDVPSSKPVSIDTIADQEDAPAYTGRVEAELGTYLDNQTQLRARAWGGENSMSLCEFGLCIEKSERKKKSARFFGPG